MVRRPTIRIIHPACTREVRRYPSDSYASYQSDQTFHNRGRKAGLSDVRICELAELDCACLWFRFELDGQQAALEELHLVRCSRVERRPTCDRNLRTNVRLLSEALPGCRG